MNVKAVALFNRLWGKACASPGYDEEEWKELQQALDNSRLIDIASSMAAHAKCECFRKSDGYSETEYTCNRCRLYQEMNRE